MFQIKPNIGEKSNKLQQKIAFQPMKFLVSTDEYYIFYFK